MTNKTQRFKISLPILKTRIEIQKDEDGNEKEVRFVEGLASGTEKDLHGDKMAPSAIQSMADSLKLHVINLNDEHNTSWQSELGEITQLNVTEKDNLVIEAKLNEMSKANDLWYALTKNNKKLGLSIGGYVKEYEMEKDESGDNPKWIRVYKDIELDHIAVTSRPAYPKAWVSVISKSMEASEQELQKVNKRMPAELNKEQHLKELAHQIVRSIQDMEADLLLEMTMVGLSYLNEEQLSLVERNLPMSKKDVSLEAEEAKKAADAEVQPEDEKAETSATPENESSEDESQVEGETKEEAEEADTTDAKSEGEESTEKSEGDEASEEDASGDGDKAETEESTETEDKSGDDSGEEENDGEGDEETEDTDSEETEGDESEESEEDESEEKSLDAKENSQVLKMVTELQKSLKKMVDTNKTLVERIEELEGQPATRKTVEITKSVGDDDSEEVSAADLKKERDEKIADLRKNHANDPALFSKIQRVRADYASRIKE
jgi:phage head maturation protease